MRVVRALDVAEELSLGVAAIAEERAIDGFASRLLSMATESRALCVNSRLHISSGAAVSWSGVLSSGPGLPVSAVGRGATGGAPPAEACGPARRYRW